MSRLLLLLTFCLVCSAASAQTWHTHLDSAKAEANAKDQPILLVFSGSDWCAGCIMLKREVLNRVTFKAYARENIVLLNADFPQRKKKKPADLTAHHESLAERFNPKGQFPVTVLLDKHGTVIDRKDGYAKESAAVFIKVVEAMVAKGADSPSTHD